MDLFDVIIAPYVWEQLDKYIDYIQYTLLNEQAAESVYADAVETLDELKTVAGSLEYCQKPSLREMGYRTINFRRHDYIFVYLVEENRAYVEAVYHTQQDYENTFSKRVI